jgi:PAS domain S-box-containing protein
VVGLSIVKPDGTVRYSSNAMSIGRNVGDRPYLGYFHDHPEDGSLFISEPFTSIAGQPAVIFCRQIRDDKGELTAIATARVTPELFGTFLEAVRPSYAQAGMTIIGPGYAVLTRQPPLGDVTPGKVLRASQLLAGQIASGERDTIQRGVAVSDGLDRLAAIHSSARYPIIVSISAPMAEVLRPWSRQVAWNLAMLAATVVVAATAAWLLSQRARERRRVAAVLAAERDLSTTLITTLPGVFYLFDADGRMLRWNANFQALSGRDDGQLAATHPLDLFEGDDKTLIAQRIAEVLATGHSVAEGAIVSAGGRRHPLYFTASRIVLDGKPCVIGVGQDISELKKLQLTLEQSNEDLRQFAYVASHQLQEPLRVIASYVQLLARRYQGQLDPEADVFIGFAVGGVKRMSALIHDLLAFARVSTHTHQPSPVNLGDVVEWVLHDLSVAITNAGAEVMVEGPLPVVRGDESLIATLLQNIIGNAVKYRHPEREPKVVVSARPAEDGWEIQVADNGIGIADEHFGKIFELFQRLHRVSDYEGTGIGLAVSRKIVEWHGGRIWVESREGEGTTFHFTLPA